MAWARRTDDQEQDQEQAEANMKKVKRDELMELGAYEQIRERFRAAVIEEKQHRRFQPSGELSVVFENHRTVLFQIQEMLRTERITREAAIAHELDTYNELVPARGELSATLFVELPEREIREPRLVELAGLEETFALEIGGELVPARNESRGVLPDRTTAVHYLKFPLGPTARARLQAAAAGAPAARADAIYFLVRHPRLEVRAPIPATVLRALREDLEEDD
jgi:hypothetical protein